MEITLNEKSNNYIVVSPIYNENENFENTAWFVDNSYEEELSLVKNQSSFKETNLVSKEKKEILEIEFLNQIEKIKKITKEEEKDDFIYNSIFNDINIKSPPHLMPEDIKNEKNEENNKTNKSTDDKSSNIVKGDINKCIFGLSNAKRIEPRIDYSIKNIKVYIIKYLKEYGNNLIKKCAFQNKLKKLKLFSPSYKYFTGISNEKDNKIFLNFTVEKIFTYPEGKTEKNDNRLQRQNKDIIKEFKDYIDEEYPEEVPEKFQNLKNFFNMTFQDAIYMFYESNQFKDYSSSPKTIFLDRQFVKAKGFSLLEKNAFFKLMKNYNKRTG